MREILDRDGTDAVLIRSGLRKYVAHLPADDHALDISFAHVSAIQSALEELFEPQPGRGLARRIGRACFKYGLRAYGRDLGLTDLAFRLLPLPARLRRGSEILAALFNERSDQKVSLEHDEQAIRWIIERCPLCYNRQSDGPACQLAVGLLEEALYWVSAGKQFQVEEKSCLACGDRACTIVIDRTPMG